MSRNEDEVETKAEEREHEKVIQGIERDLKEYDELYGTSLLGKMKRGEIIGMSSQKIRDGIIDHPKIKAQRPFEL